MDNHVEKTFILSAAERDAAIREIQKAQAMDNREAGQAVIQAIESICDARQRTLDRRDSDRRTDARRRVLVGARLQRDAAKRCKACAKVQGESLYRFVSWALMLRCHDVERSKGLVWDAGQHTARGGI